MCISMWDSFYLLDKDKVKRLQDEGYQIWYGKSQKSELECPYCGEPGFQVLASKLLRCEHCHIENITVELEWCETQHTRMIRFPNNIHAFDEENFEACYFSQIPSDDTMFLGIVSKKEPRYHIFEFIHHDVYCTTFNQTSEKGIHDIKLQPTHSLRYFLKSKKPEDFELAYWRGHLNERISYIEMMKILEIVLQIAKVKYKEGLLEIDNLPKYLLSKLEA